MSSYKIVFTGPVGAGKTTAIASISDITPFSTEEAATDEVRAIKQNTTVAMDHGMMKLENGEHIHLYGTPGQQRFDFMWEILVEGSIGLVLLINHEARAPLEDLAFYLDKFEDFINQAGVVVGITRMQAGQGPGIDDFHAVMGKQGCTVPIFEVDPRVSNDVALLVQSLLYSLDPSLTQ